MSLERELFIVNKIDHLKKVQRLSVLCFSLIGTVGAVDNGFFYRTELWKADLGLGMTLTAGAVGYYTFHMLRHSISRLDRMKSHSKYYDPVTQEKLK